LRLCAWGRRWFEVILFHTLIVIHILKEKKYWKVFFFFILFTQEIPTLSNHTTYVISKNIIFFKQILDGIINISKERIFFLLFSYEKQFFLFILFVCPQNSNEFLFSNINSNYDKLKMIFHFKGIAIERINLFTLYEVWII
jgi:hypothetical protein